MPATQDVPPAERELAIQTCRALIAGQLGIVEGARRFASVPHVMALGSDDPQIGMLDALAAETAHLSVADGGGAFDDATIAQHAAERARLESLVRDEVVAACQSLLRRLGAS